MQARFKEIFKKTVRALESDAKTHRTPKALRAKSIGKRLIVFRGSFRSAHASSRRFGKRLYAPLQHFSQRSGWSTRLSFMLARVPFA